MIVFDLLYRFSLPSGVRPGRVLLPFPYFVHALYLNNEESKKRNRNKELSFDVRIIIQKYLTFHNNYFLGQLGILGQGYST